MLITGFTLLIKHMFGAANMQIFLLKIFLKISKEQLMTKRRKKKN